jgi:rubrerythrin
VSIVESLIKLVDPVQAEAREQERRKDREQPQRANAAAPPEFECRVCGHRATNGAHCPVCLADTMKRVRVGRPGAG